MSFPKLHCHVTVCDNQIAVDFSHDGVSSYCVKIIDFCNKPVQAAKEMAGGGLMNRQRSYKNNRLVAA